MGQSLEFAPKLFIQVRVADFIPGSDGVAAFRTPHLQRFIVMEVVMAVHSDAIAHSGANEVIGVVAAPSKKSTGRAGRRSCR